VQKERGWFLGVNVVLFAPIILLDECNVVHSEFVCHRGCSIFVLIAVSPCFAVVGVRDWNIGAGLASDVGVVSLSSIIIVRRYEMRRETHLFCGQ
jgi:hypothetical protein